LFLSINLTTFLSIYLSFYLSFFLSFFLSIYLSFVLSFFLSFYDSETQHLVIGQLMLCGGTAVAMWAPVIALSRRRRRLIRLIAF
jgi:uncharacterized membrane protein YadS